MKLSRIIVCLAGWMWMGPGPLRAQDFWMPYVIGRHYRATETITAYGFPAAESRIYVDGANIRMERPSGGGTVVTIIRPDLLTVYWAILSRKQLLVLPLDLERIKKEVPPATVIPGRSQSLGIETVQGVDCMKCRLTNESGKAFLLWTDAQKKTPVKIASEDGSYLLVWKDYRAGPQVAGLFDPPDDFQDVGMPLSPQLPGPVTFPPKGLAPAQNSKASP